MVYLTGDTHIPVDVKKLNMDSFPEQKSLSRDDFVIVLGDFGLLWKEDKTYFHWKKWFEDKPFTTLWLDGNHESFDMINRLPVSEWHGGKVHFVSDNIIHLMRGQVFDICGKTFFVCGGATSVDKEHRTFGVSWWPEENLSYAECAEALENFDKAKEKVDFILTHTCPLSMLRPMFNLEPLPCPTAKFLDEIAELAKENIPWYFGHHHIDADRGRWHCLYRRVVRVV